MKFKFERTRFSKDVGDWVECSNRDIPRKGWFFFVRQLRLWFKTWVFK